MPNPKGVTWYFGAGGLAGMGMNVVSKDYTFVNLAADLPLFTVTGDVLVKIVAVCVVDLTSAGACNASVGATGETAALIALTDVTTIDAGEVWTAAAPATKITPMTAAPIEGFVVPRSLGIKLTRTAQIDSGQIIFYCLWAPLSANGNVVAA